MRFDPRPRSLFAATAALLIPPLLGACSGAPAGWTPLAVEALDDDGRAQLARAERARDQLGLALLGALSQALESGGPAAAIEVCAELAPKLAAESELPIGRTSWKLRNAGNRAPDWAEELLADRPADPRLARDSAGRLGATFPIRVADRCLTCHGERGSLGAQVLAALDERYPDDAATGFAAGDLRGWFWVEVPAPGR